MTAVIGELEGTVIAYEGRLEEKQGEYRNLCNKIRDYKATISAFETSKSNLDVEGARKASVTLALRSKLTSKEQSLSQCVTERDELKSKLTIAGENSRGTLEHLFRATSERAQLQERLATQDGEHAGLLERIKELEEALAASKRKPKTPKDEESGLQKQVKEPEEEFEAGKQSPAPMKGDDDLLHDISATTTGNPQPGTESLQLLLGQYIETRTKEAEEVAAVQTLLKALTRSHEQLDDKDGALTAVSRELADLKDSKSKEEPQPCINQEAADTTRSHKKLQELTTLVAEQALEIRGLRSHLQRIQKKPGGRPRHANRAIARIATTNRMSREQEATLTEEISLPDTDQTIEESDEQEAVSDSGTEFHDASQISETEGMEETTATLLDLLDLDEE